MPENRTGLCWGYAGVAGAGGRAGSLAGLMPVLLVCGLCPGTGQPRLQGKAEAQKGVLAHAQVCFQIQSATDIPELTLFKRSVDVIGLS